MNSSKPELLDVLRDFEDIKEQLHLIDIPSPTVPEYVEHHEGVQSVLRLVKEKIEKYEDQLDIQISHNGDLNLWRN